MNFFKYSFLFIFSSLAFAKNMFQVFEFGKSRIYFAETKNKLWVNYKCIKSSCHANKFIERKFTIPPVVKGGQNPASLICKQVLLGQVVIGKDNNKNEQSFCRFNDGSLLMLNEQIYRN